MKNKLFFIEALLICAIALGTASCTMNDSKKTAEEMNKEKIQTQAQEKDAKFLVEVAEITLKEIELGRLAQTKSQNQQVRELGKLMVDEHTASLNALKDLADRKGVAIPTTITEKIQRDYNLLNQKKEPDFNEEYCDKMVEEHKDAIDKVESASQESQDEEIREWATAALPILRKNLDHALACQMSDTQFESSFAK